MRKSEYAYNFWRRKTSINANARHFKKFALMPKAERCVRKSKYWFFNLMFNFAMAEFHVNIWAGQLFVFMFNLTNLHKIRVNRLVQHWSNKCGETIK